MGAVTPRTARTTVATEIEMDTGLHLFDVKAVVVSYPHGADHLRAKQVHVDCAGKVLSVEQARFLVLAVNKAIETLEATVGRRPAMSVEEFEARVDHCGLSDQEANG